MDKATVQSIITTARRRDGSLQNCMRCGNTYRRYASLWCPTCREFFCCGHQYQLLGHIIRSDGSRQGWKWCLSCGKLTAARRAEGTGEYLFHDLRDENDVPPCERCGDAGGTQLHHWAPSAIFGGREANRWPTAYLCQPCHSLWHRLMRLAAGVRLPPEERIDDYGTPQTTTADTEVSA